MTYLIGEIILWLALAALVGLAAGWAARGVFGVRDAAQKSETDWSARSATAEAGFEARTLAAEAANARLRADLHAAQMRAAGLEAEGGARVRELEATLRTRLHAAEALAEERGQAEARLRAALDTASAAKVTMPCPFSAFSIAGPRPAIVCRSSSPGGGAGRAFFAIRGAAGAGVSRAARRAVSAAISVSRAATLRNGFAERFVRDDWAGQARAALAAREAPAATDGAP